MQSALTNAYADFISLKRATGSAAKGNFGFGFTAMARRLAGRDHTRPTRTKAYPAGPGPYRPSRAMRLLRLVPFEEQRLEAEKKGRVLLGLNSPCPCGVGRTHKVKQCGRFGAVAGRKQKEGGVK